MSQLEIFKSRLQEQAAPLLERFYEQWDALNQRERLVVSLLAAVVVFALIMLVIYLPLVKKRDEAQLRYESNVELLTWMSSVAPQIKQQASSGSASAQSAQAIMNTVNQTAQANQLKLDRIQPEGKNNLRVWIQDASFDAMMRWLVDLQNNSGIVVNNINIDSGKSSGTISARVVLSGG